MHPFAWLDKDGCALPAEVCETLAQLVPRLRRTFPTMRDEAVLADVVEEAARRVSRRLLQREIVFLHAYAWTTLRTVTVSRLRAGAARVRQRECSLDDRALSSTVHRSSRSLEDGILLRELLRRLSGDERMVSALKLAGLSSEDIGDCIGLSPGAVNTIYSRAKTRLCKLRGSGRAEDH